MILRRKLHKVFDMIKCEAWMNIIEANGYIGDKNLILKDFYLTVEQLKEIKKGKLQEKMISMTDMLLNHLR